MHRPPGDLRHLVGVGEFGAQAAGGDRVRAGLPQEPVGILARVALRGAVWALRFGLSLGRRVMKRNW